MNKIARELLRNSAKLSRKSDGVKLANFGSTNPAKNVTVVTALCEGNDTTYRTSVVIAGKSVRVHCDCDDYAYTFYPILSMEGFALKKVVRPKPKGTGGPRAVNQVGICKHIMALLERTNNGH